MSETLVATLEGIPGIDQAPPELISKEITQYFKPFVMPTGWLEDIEDLDDINQKVKRSLSPINNGTDPETGVKVGREYKRHPILADFLKDLNYIAFLAGTSLATVPRDQRETEAIRLFDIANRELVSGFMDDAQKIVQKPLLDVADEVEVYIETAFENTEYLKAQTEHNVRARYEIFKLLAFPIKKGGRYLNGKAEESVATERLARLVFTGDHDPRATDSLSESLSKEFENGSFDSLVKEDILTFSLACEQSSNDRFEPARQIVALLKGLKPNLTTEEVIKYLSTTVNTLPGDLTKLFDLSKKELSVEFAANMAWLGNPRHNVLLHNPDTAQTEELIKNLHKRVVNILAPTLPKGQITAFNASQRVRNPRKRPLNAKPITSSLDPLLSPIEKSTEPKPVALVSKDGELIPSDDPRFTKMVETTKERMSNFFSTKEEVLNVIERLRNTFTTSSTPINVKRLEGQVKRNGHILGIWSYRPSKQIRILFTHLDGTLGIFDIIHRDVLGQTQDGLIGKGSSRKT